jgi:hypothetical protein
LKDIHWPLVRFYFYVNRFRIPLVILGNWLFLWLLQKVVRPSFRHELLVIVIAQCIMQIFVGLWSARKIYRKYYPMFRELQITNTSERLRIEWEAKQRYRINVDLEPTPEEIENAVHEEFYSALKFANKRRK